MPARSARRSVQLTVRLMLVGLTLAAASCSGPAREARGGPGTERVPYGTVMADLSRRFELVGRAVVAGRFELAEYELGEIEDQVAEALPRASPPKEGHPEVLPALAAEFLEVSLAALRRSVTTHDRAQAAAGFESTARACNGCHQSSGHGFIEVPLVAGRAIPSLEPLENVK